MVISSLGMMAHGERKHYVPYLLIYFVTGFTSVYSQCTKESEPCPDKVCENDCGSTSASDGSVEAIVAIMSVSLVLIVGLVTLLVYVCIKQGHLFFNNSNEDASESNAITCERTAVEIPEYFLRRRSSSASITSGPPSYFSLFNFICNENGNVLQTVIGPQNLRPIEDEQLPSVSEQPPAYGALFGQLPPPYDDVVIQLDASTPIVFTPSEQPTHDNPES